MKLIIKKFNEYVICTFFKLQKVKNKIKPNALKSKFLYKLYQNIEQNASIIDCINHNSFFFLSISFTKIWRQFIITLDVEQFKENKSGDIKKLFYIYATSLIAFNFRKAKKRK